MNLGLAGKRAILPASSKGLGQTVAKTFAEEGMDVVINSRDEERLEDARETVLEDAAPGVEVHAVTGDLSNEEDVRRVYRTGIDLLGGLDVLVTNHGGTLRRSFDETDVDLLDQTYESVVRSTFLGVKESLPALQRDGGGSITHIVSTSAREPPANHIPSNILRLGIYGLSKSIANEFGEENVRSNCLGPRMVMTDRIENIFEEDADRMGVSEEEARREHVDSLPLNRVGSPEEFAAVVAFLSSDVASYITGASLAVDGGWTSGAVL